MNEVASYTSLKDKVVLITGGASGNGETIVENFFAFRIISYFLNIQNGKKKTPDFTKNRGLYNN